MTVIATETGYLEKPYLSEDPYLSGQIAGAMGFQANLIIETQDQLGMQANGIIDDDNPVGMEAFGFIGTTVGLGFQANAIIDFTNPVAMQAVGNIDDDLALGFEAIQDTLSHTLHDKYLVEPYLSQSYLASLMCANLGMQANAIIETTDAQGMQANLIIEDRLVPIGMQAAITIDALNALGFQADSVAVLQLGMQATIVIYNDNRLRVMCDFPSRGLTTTNWTASSTEPGDYDINNLDTDIPEQIWRSATGVVTSINITCDTGIPQGVAVDTIFIDNHNFTSSASIVVQASNDAGFGTIGFTTTMEVTEDRMFYIKPTAALEQYRYWRFNINDTTNPDGFISIGIIAFGSAIIFQDNCFTDQIRYEVRDFADTVPTEGFTNVANSRALRNILGLEFRLIDSNQRSFELLDDIFRDARTILKCLWIPTPSSTNQELTKKFAAFGKLTRLPVRTHNNKGPDLDYATFTIEVDESK